MLTRQFNNLMAVEYAQSSSHEDEEEEEQKEKGSKKKEKTNARCNSAWMR